jgi:signal transduction histidine kinase
MRVMQILINFITNAIKFSPKNSTIIVMLKQIQSAEIDNFCYYDVSVTDQGIGMSEIDVANLFKPYFKTKDKLSSELNTNSHGLGLSISMSMSKLLGYNITVDSSPGKGSTFTLKMKFEGRATNVETKVIKGRK